jgi:hypothetical protein
MGISAKRLMATFEISPSDAKRLARMTREFVDAAFADARYVRPKWAEGLPSSDDVLEEANRLLKGFGVEATQCESCQVDKYYYGIVLLYVNMGETYETTFMYDTEKGRFLIGSWGDWFERHEAQHAKEDG